MDNKWLKKQFQLHPEKKKAELADRLGIGAPAVSKMLTGGRQIKAHEYVVMRRFFGLPVDGDRAATLAGGGSSHQSAYVLSPLDSQFKDNDDGDPGDENRWVMPASLFEKRTKAPPEKIRIFSIQDQAMMPGFAPGEHVLVDLSDQKPSPSGVFVLSDGMGYIVRQCEYVPHSSPPKVKLSAHNDQYDSYTIALEKAAIIGRVIAKLQWQ